jgi:asparagine synthase (glutamine-hydrolysing)
VDFCRRLPNRWKFRNGTRKYLLRRALHGLVPSEVLARRKQGFGVPVADWLRRLPFPDARPDVPGLKLEGFRRVWRDHAEGRSEERLLLWTWLVLSTWATQQAEGDSVAV